MKQSVRMNPVTAEELEQTIDSLIWRSVRSLETDYPGIEDIVGKMAPNQYHVGDKIIHLNLHKGVLVVRVGGGFMEFNAWVMKQGYSIRRFLSTASQTVSAGGITTTVVGG